MSKLPDELRRRAFHAANGELAWPRSDAIEAARTTALLGMANLGGEGWIVGEDGSVSVGANGGIYCWAVDPGWDHGSETWQEFCHRAADQTIAALEQSVAFEMAIPPEQRLKVRYNLTCVTHDESLELRTPPVRPDTTTSGRS